MTIPLTTDVLIAGAGPTGLVLALWLTRQGVRVRIVDSQKAAGTTSRALLVQARTLELYRQLDLTDEVLSAGHRATAMNMWVDGSHKARIDLGALGEGLTPYPFLHIYPQDQHEHLLESRLAALGVTVEREVSLEGFTDDGDSVTASLRRVDGTVESVSAAYIAGCDGARSAVRKIIGSDFPGDTYRQVFYVADVEGSGPAFNGEMHIDLSESDFLAVFAMDGGRRARLVGVVSDERADRAETLEFEDISTRPLKDLAITDAKVNWFSTYHVHHRVAERFRVGRAFLVGDAGHIHSPAGGQGMNTGIGDAINLAWKLAAVVQGQASDSLLDSYEAERRPFALQLVETTDRIFTFATTEGRVAGFLRTRLAPLALPLAARFDAAKAFMFRIISQTMISYRDGPLAEGRAREVEGGDRLPWAAHAGRDNFDDLKTIDWCVHVYGQANGPVRQACDRLGLALHEFVWEPVHAQAGFARDAVYLIRPDTYVALADPTANPGVLEQYFVRRGLRRDGPSAG